MVFGNILRDTFIAGEPVTAGDVVEVDASTFRLLAKYDLIEKCDPPKGEKASESQAPITFRKVAKKKPAAPAE